jgi:serine/threonine-protein kinase
MDSDLDIVAHGGHVPGDTADAATVVLAGGRAVDASTAVTQVTRRGQPVGPGHPEEYRPIGRRRSPWPWLLAVGALLAVLVGGWLLWDAFGDELGGSGQVAVPYVVGIEEDLAVADIEDAGLVPNVRRVPSSDVEEGLVIDQDPKQGTKLDRESVVTIDVSSGKPEVEVPNVVGLSVESAVASLSQAGLSAQVVEVFSDRDAGTVTAQQPKSDTVVVEGTRVRINVSKGARPIGVPPVIGQPFESAASTLQAAGFKVQRRDVDSNQPAGTVVDQQPGANTLQPAGATIVLSVSNGPSETGVPDVTSISEADAVSTLEAEGFQVDVQREDTDDPALDGFVLSQNPEGGAQAPAGSTVTIVVGRFEG